MKHSVIYNDPWARAVVSNAWAFWDNAFTEEELQAVTEYCDAQGLEQGVTFSGVNMDIRNSAVKFHKRNAENGWIFDRINFILQLANESFFGYNLNGYDSFQYTVYESSEQQHYDWHMDMHHGAREGYEETRKLSMTLLLNDDFDGGKFQLNLGQEKNCETIPTQRGRAILFPSYMIHRVTPVTSGTRKSIVVWCTGPKFQ